MKNFIKPTPIIIALKMLGYNNQDIMKVIKDLYPNVFRKKRRLK